MPELPEIEALAAFLRDRAVGRAVARVDVASFTAIKTYDPPTTALLGMTVDNATRHGKFLDIEIGGLHLITHLSRAGWLHWRESLPAAPPKPGKSPIAVRVHLAPEFDGGPMAGFDLTEAGTQKRLAVYIVNDASQVPGIARLGPDALDPGFDVIALKAAISAQRGQLKRVITDQSIIAGIGNAYSDEILHVAKLSPFKMSTSLSDDEVARLHEAMVATLADAVQRSVGQKAATLKGEKRSGFRVHARTGLPCPVCGDTVREVSFADRSFQYCPTCQTEGRALADRRMSKLLK
ncbi:MAG: mutM [Pseudonocardiales bacterium]|nr:mutM [Pseudonocardiales bacterium]